jgi:hypothetical protein
MIWQIVLIGAFFVLLVYLISKFATYNYMMNHISDYVYEVARREVIREYKKAKRPIYTKNKEFTTSVEKAIETRVTDINKTCQFYSKDFYYYYKQNRPILKSRIDDLIAAYLHKKVDKTLKNNFREMTPEQFFKTRENFEGDIVGVYILYNKKKKMYYVGQSNRLFFRVNQHLTGHGNGDVYADYKRGRDKFTIKLVPLVNSGYYDLDKLEKDLIKRYNAFEKGYNKTAGNG